MSLTDHAFGVAGCTACHALRMEYTEKREKNKNVAVNFTRRNNLQPRHFSMLSVSSSELVTQKAWSYERVRENPKIGWQVEAKNERKRTCHHDGFWDNNCIMNVTVENLTKKVRALPPREFDEFLSWLSEFEVEQMDAWDRGIERDSRSGGRLKTVLARVHTDIAAGRTKPLDDIINNS